MPDTTPSNFGLNLFLHFVLACIFSVIAATWYDPTFMALGSVFGTVFWMSFTFGLFYGFFRMLGAKSEALESFYQSFPVPNKRVSFGEAEIARREQPAKSATRGAYGPSTGAVEIHFDWQQLFSFKYLRYAGVALVLSAVFSLLFKIEWGLVEKIIASSIAGFVLLGGAEFMKKKSTGISSFCGILSFALLQFSLTLLYSYARTMSSWGDTSTLLVDANFWLGAKLLLTIVCLPMLSRYKAEWFAAFFFLVASFTPFSLLLEGALIVWTCMLAFLGALLLIMAAVSVRLKKDEIALVATITTNLSLIWTMEFATVQAMWSALGVGVLTLIVVLALGIASARRATEKSWAHFASVTLEHAFMLVLFWNFSDYLPLLSNYMGIAILIVANITLIAYLVAGMKKVPVNFSDFLLNSAIIMASIGMFLQVRGPWSSVLFLAYSCAVLWVSLYMRNIRTRIYGFVALTISLIKLYLQFQEIFDDVWGTVAILVIGLFLMFLSYKFEKVKDVVLHGLKPVKS